MKYLFGIQRIILITEEWPGTMSGGVGTVVYDQAAAYYQMGFEVIVYCIVQTKKSASCAVQPYSTAIQLILVEAMQNETRQKIFSSLIKGHSRVLVHNHSERSFLESRLVPSDVPHVFSVHGVLKGYVKCLNIERKRDSRIHIPRWMHIDGRDQVELIQYLLNQCDFTVPSQSEAESFRKYLRITNSIHVLHTAFNQDRYLLRRSLDSGMVAAERGIYFIGRLSPEKGVFDFFDAAYILLERYQKMRVVVVGSLPTGSSACEVRRELARHPRVQWFGEVHQTLMPKFIKDCGILVAPSLYDPCPCTVIEAAASGCHVLLTPRGGAKEVVGVLPTVTLMKDIGALAIVQGIEEVLEKPLPERKELVHWRSHNSWYERLRGLLTSLL